MKALLKTVGLTLLLLTGIGKSNASSMITMEYCSETGDIKGTVNDEYDKAIEFANVIVEGTGNGATTAEDGSFTIHGINPGKYDVKASYVGKKPSVINGVAIGANQTAYLKFKLMAPLAGGLFQPSIRLW